MYRWPRDTCYHFASPGIFIASANEPTGWWSIASRDNQHSNRYPLAIFKRTKYSYSFKSRRYSYWPPLPASCFAETPAFSYPNTLGRIDKKVWYVPEENEKKKINLWRFGNSLSENFEIFQKIRNMGKLKLLDTSQRFIVHSLFFSCVSDTLSKCNKPFALVYCLSDRMF